MKFDSCSLNLMEEQQAELAAVEPPAEYEGGSDEKL